MYILQRYTQSSPGIKNRSTCSIYTVVSAFRCVGWMARWEGREEGCRLWRGECPDRPRHTEALTVTFVLGSGKISQQAWKPLKPFSKIAQIRLAICWTICKLQCHLSPCSQSPGCKCSSVIFIRSAIGQASSGIWPLNQIFHQTLENVNVNDWWVVTWSDVCFKASEVSRCLFVYVPNKLECILPEGSA